MPVATLRQLLSQVSKYGVIGLLTNVFGYLFYLLLAEHFMTPKISMTVVYCTVASVSFYANGRFTFDFGGVHKWAFMKYLITHLMAYSINLAGLYLFVDIFGFAHQVVQAIMIIFAAFFVFIMCKYFVFSYVFFRRL